LAATVSVVGVGTDLVEVARFRLAMRRSTSLVERLFSDDERAYASDQNDPAKSLAARFAAKEAVMKALGTGWARGVSWTDIDVKRLPSGKPEVTLRGKCKEIADGLGIARLDLSITHTDGHAAASVVATSA
jgi:holo-[acyl-carrier protein] synthase